VVADSVAAARRDAGDRMSIKRSLRHLITPAWAVRRVFTDATLLAIEQAIGATESTHGGEIRFALEGNLSPAELWRGVTPRQRAVQVFAQLGVWDTEANNGVLIYLSWADRDVEIVADRGYNGRVSADQWTQICSVMERQFAADKAQHAVVEGIAAVGKLIAQHFPVVDRNELSDRPVLL
jgi:hypothetical protein